MQMPAMSRRLRSNDGFASEKGTLHQQSKLNQSHSVCVSSLLKRTLLFVALEPLLPGTGPATPSDDLQAYFLNSTGWVAARDRQHGLRQ